VDGTAVAPVAVVSARYPALAAAIPFALGILAGGSQEAGRIVGPGGVGVGPRIAAASLVGLALVPAASFGTTSRLAGACAAFALGVVRAAEGAPPPLAAAARYASDSLWIGRVGVARPGGFRLDGVRPVEGAGGLDQSSGEFRENAPRARIPGLVDVFVPGDSPPPAFGSIVLVRGALETIESRRNPGLPDPRQLARRDRVVARLRAREPARAVAAPGSAARFAASVAAWRERFAARQDALYPADAAAFLRALFLGDRTLLDPALRADFRDTGAAHLLALSGQHVVLVAMLIARGLTFLRIPRRLHLPASLLALGAYLVLVGAPSSIARAGVVIALILVAAPLRRRSEPGNVLGVALLVLLALNPSGLWDAGLTLSFAATAGLVFLLPIVRERFLPDARGPIRHVIEAIRVTIAATWPLVPLEGAYFGAIPVVGVATNILLVPATGLLLALHVAVLALSVLPFEALGLPSPARDLAATTALLSHGTVAAVRAFARILPPPVAVPAAWLPFAALFAVVSVLVLFPPRAFRGAVWLAAPLVALVLVAAPSRPPLRITVFDVGQGDAILVEGSAARVLVDAGPAWSRWDSGERVVVPALRARGVRTLDALVLSHGDADHCGGAAAVLDALRVTSLFEPDPSAAPRSRIHARAREAAARAGTPDRALAEGDSIFLGGRRRALRAPTATACVLHPPRGGPRAGLAPGGNERSIQLDVACGRVHVFLTGDLPTEEEARLFREGLLPRGAILKVAHHGSRGSTGAAYLGALRPPAALISVGAKNRYHHPHPLLLERLAASRATILRTDDGGALVVESDGTRAIIRASLAAAPALRLVYLAPDDPRIAGPIPRAPVSAEPPAYD